MVISVIFWTIVTLSFVVVTSRKIVSGFSYPSPIVRVTSIQRGGGSIERFAVVRLCWKSTPSVDRRCMDA